jgi:hypothetical protein
MSLDNSPKMVTDGLVFHYDMRNPKSWKGKPTTNYAYLDNAKPQSSYTPYIATASDLWTTHHPDAIRAYNYAGTEITGYVNTGVTNWANTYHGAWTYDRVLKKPVVTMRDVDNNWKAKYLGLFPADTPTGMGLSANSLYSISWLQWTDDITKSVNAGLYGPDSGGSYNFHDGLSQYANHDYTYAFNTKPYTWQRVWATFSVNPVRNLSAIWSCYMYGYFNSRATVKIADVQVETGYASGFLENGASTRSNTQALLDLTGRNTITANSLTYNSNGLFSFGGSSRLTLTLSGSATSTEYTRIVWIKPTQSTVDTKSVMLNQIGNNSDMAVGIENNKAVFHQYTRTNTSGTTDGDYTASGSTTLSTNNIYMIAVTVNRNISTNNINIYLNGLLDGTASLTLGAASSDNVIIGGPANDDYGGARMFYGDCYAAAHYNRALTATEIQQNFNAHRGRYGI